MDTYKTVYDFVTVKKFNDGTEKIYIKKGVLKSKTDEDFEREKSIPQIMTSIQSANRAFNLLLDLANNNTWQWFITFTFSDEKTKGQRLNDVIVKGIFMNWRKYFKKKLPHMYYIVVPEYHEKGGLHFHGLLGGVTADDLKLYDSGKVCCHWVSNGYASRDYFERTKHAHSLNQTDGDTVFNCGAWRYGFSTITAVKSPEAVKNYVAKYIGKGKIDPRFFNQKRFWASRNIERPYIEKIKHEIGIVHQFDKEYTIMRSYLNDMEINLDDYHIEYADDDKYYLILRKKKGDEQNKEKINIYSQKNS